MLNILSALRSGALAAWSFIIRNPVITFVLVVIGIGYFAFLRPAYSTIDERDATIAAKGDTIATLKAERARAIAVADSTLKKTQAIKDEIRKTVDAMPAAERTRLNRRLLADLGLLD